MSQLKQKELIHGLWILNFFANIVWKHFTTFSFFTLFLLNILHGFLGSPYGPMACCWSTLTAIKRRRTPFSPSSHCIIARQCVTWTWAVSQLRVEASALYRSMRHLRRFPTALIRRFLQPSFAEPLVSRSVWRWWWWCDFAIMPFFKPYYCYDFAVKVVNIRVYIICKFL